MAEDVCGAIGAASWYVHKCGPHTALRGTYYQLFVAPTMDKFHYYLGGMCNCIDELGAAFGSVVKFARGNQCWTELLYHLILSWNQVTTFSAIYFERVCIIQSTRDA